MKCLSIKDLKEGQTVWYCPLQLKKSISISNIRINIPVDCYSNCLECTVTTIDLNRNTVDIVAKNYGYVPYTWCRNYGTTQDMTSFLFETEEDAKKGRKACLVQLKETLLEKLSGMMNDLDYIIDTI